MRFWDQVEYWIGVLLACVLLLFVMSPCIGFAFLLYAAGCWLMKG